MLVPFLESLFDHGRVRVGHPDQALTEDELWQAGELLVRYEAVQRSGFPGEPPRFAFPVAIWAAKAFYRACQAATFRDLPADLLSAFLGEECPAGEPASLHYTVDLVFQFLPDLTKLAGHAMPDDPLVEHLRKWANQWPLSSVGMKDVNPPSLGGMIEHPGLLQYYVDRLIARRDVTRLTDPLVRNAAQHTLSIYQDLFPEFSERLRT